MKPDYGDRVPEDALFANGRTGREMHNLYLALYSQAAFEITRDVRGEGVVWRRAGYIGSQRYPGTWAGDAGKLGSVALLPAWGALRRPNGGGVLEPRHRWIRR